MSYTREQALRDKAKLEQIARCGEARGDPVGASHCIELAEQILGRVGSKKNHEPNIDGIKPGQCMDCGKPEANWVELEECIPTSASSD